jgi:hypothetical protein
MVRDRQASAHEPFCDGRGHRCSIVRSILIRDLGQFTCEKKPFGRLNIGKAFRVYLA